MSDPSVARLTPHNYHTWKPHMTRLLMSRGLWSCMDAVQPVLQRPYEALMHRNRMDEAMGLIAMNVSDGLLFHLDGLTTPRDMWDKFSTLFGTMDQFRILQIDAEFTSLAPDSFTCIEDFLMKFKSLRSILQAAGKTKSDDECIFLILSKLRGPYQIFTSTFYSTMDALGTRHVMPSFETFCDRLTREQSKLSQMDSLTGSQSQALLAKSSQDTQKPKPKQISDSSSQHSTGSPSPSKKENQKTQIPTCSYCQKRNHDESQCFQKRCDGYEKQIADLQALLQKSTISSPSSSTSQGSAFQSSASSSSSGQDFGKGHALRASVASPSQVPWILDSGASHHMASSQELFSSFETSPIPHILMGNNTVQTVCGTGSVSIQDGTFNDVLYVPSLSANLLSIYQITRSGSGKTVEFTADSAFIRDSVIGGIIATGTVDHSSRLYIFSHFGPPSPLSELSSPLSREHHVVQSGRLNLCVVPETRVVTATPHPEEYFSLQPDSSSALLDPPAPFIEPPGAVVEDSSEDTHLLSHDSVSTPVIPLALGIPFQDPHVFSFEHQLGLPVTPHPSRSPLQHPLTFTPLHWSHSGFLIAPGVLSFWGALEPRPSLSGGVSSTHCTTGFERVS